MNYVEKRKATKVDLVFSHDYVDELAYRAQSSRDMKSIYTKAINLASSLN